MELLRRCAKLTPRLCEEDGLTTIGGELAQTVLLFLDDLEEDFLCADGTADILLELRDPTLDRPELRTPVFFNVETRREPV